MKNLGILAPVFSLVGRQGIGDFGKEAYEFVDVLAKNKVSIWQILPMNPVGYGNSPYQPYSSYAGDEVYISGQGLYEMGLINSLPRKITTDHVDYEAVRNIKQRMLKRAYIAFLQREDLQDDYNQFVKETSWLETYANFITLKKYNYLSCWLEWPKKHKEWIEKKEYDIEKHRETIEYEKFIQYMFYKQWFALKEYANAKGIQIVGDIPIYVGIDSADVWANKNTFLLDEHHYPTFIAGVPPDYFSATGQRWGNPLYDWDYLEENNFQFWIERLAWSSKLFDQIRIDHFRGFDTYWKIPASSPTAILGSWHEAPGYALFDTIKEQLPTISIVAEDLGLLRQEVLDLRDHYHLPGMEIIQFVLDLDSEEIRKEEKRNVYVYSGTHDNNTLLGFLEECTEKQRKNLEKQYKDYNGKTIYDKIMNSLLHSLQDTVIFPLQDVLCLNQETRLNTPGTVGAPNWQWKLKELNSFEIHLKTLLEEIL
ncbi:4-alpha-glucanotransferase [Tannockella kyphosi]|uniref:4-alpha-glucanotransferase n=1 Tax=Tannockella kyphosi TaxID=2899121 RepID=UPI0020126B79|nr:4-alpha-glucanotransferase [Tannockella kyphosi]